jgi:hypothetical protein
MQDSIADIYKRMDLIYTVQLCAVGAIGAIAIIAVLVMDFMDKRAARRDRTRR